MRRVCEISEHQLSWPLTVAFPRGISWWWYICVVLLAAGSGSAAQVLADADAPPGDAAVWMVSADSAAAGSSHNIRWAADGHEIAIPSYGEASWTMRGLPKLAARRSYLYLLLDLPSPAQITVHYRRRGDEMWDSQRSAWVGPPTFVAGPHAYRLDMRAMPKWNTEIEEIQISLEGLMPGATVGFGGVAGSVEALNELAGSGQAWPVASVSAHAPYQGERFVACSRTVVSVDEATAAAGLCTYIANPATSNPYGLNFDPQSQLGLAQFTMGIEIDGRHLTHHDATQVRVLTRPGAICSQLEFSGDQVDIQVTPLRAVSDTQRAEGAVLYRIKSVRGAPVSVRVGQMAPMTVWERGLWLRTGKPPQAAGSARVESGTVSLAHPAVPYHVVLRASPGGGEPTISQDGASSEVRFAQGDGWIVAAFAPELSRAAELTANEPLQAEQESLAYFDQLLQHFRIKTPHPALDEAFRTAWLTMDYTWVKPYGCTESLHHWWAIWQQYPSASFELGRTGGSHA